MAAISKEEYLKRYLSKDTSKEKKKKKKVKAAKHSNVRIIDDDVDIKMIPAATRHVEEDPEDEEPTVAEVVDERPQHVQRLEAYRKDQRWKVIGKDKEKDEMATKDYGVIASGTGHRQRHDSDSSASPPRRKRHDSDSDTGKSQPARKGRQDSDSDPSPVRRRRHDSDSDTNAPHRTKGQTANAGPKRGSQSRSKSPARDSKARRKRHDSDLDQSPARRRPGRDSDHSPPRKQRPGHDSDHSPPRKQRPGRDSDHSPPRKQRHDSGSDQSPPRRRTKRADTDQSPPRRQRHDSGSDQSPPRKRRHDSDSDQSPPRKRKGDRGSDPSPPRKSKGGTKSDPSPPRRKRHGSSDQSPPRKRRADRDEDQSPPRLSKKAENSAKPEKTLGGAKAGLSSAAEMKREAEKMKKKEAAVFSKIDKEALGQEAQTVFRDKSGKRRNLAEEQKEEEEEAKKKAVEDKKYEEWGKGLKQKELREQVLEEMVHEASKPLARYKDDQDLDRIMRDMEREGDPMAMFLKKKKTKNDDAANEKLRYRGPAPPPNRFGIMPGYRWDGVDRSNGFEKQIFTKMSEQKAVKEHAYKWSTEDM